MAAKDSRVKLVEYKLSKCKTDIVRDKITSSSDSVSYIRKFYFEDLGIFESFFMLTLDMKNVVTGYVKISQGGIGATVVDIRLVAKYAIESLSSGVIVAHNHPSGNTDPSRQDRIITEKIKKGLAILDITLLDHIIITDDDYYSFADSHEL